MPESEVMSLSSVWDCRSRSMPLVPSIDAEPAVLMQPRFCIMPGNWISPSALGSNLRLLFSAYSQYLYSTFEGQKESRRISNSEGSDLRGDDGSLAILAIMDCIKRSIVSEAVSFSDLALLMSWSKVRVRPCVCMNDDTRVLVDEFARKKASWDLMWASSWAAFCVSPFRELVKYCELI